jgi:energy-coupling factor transporter transmembrane protein EcfT
MYVIGLFLYVAAKGVTHYFLPGIFCILTSAITLFLNVTTLDMHLNNYPLKPVVNYVPSAENEKFLQQGTVRRLPTISVRVSQQSATMSIYS